ncbi:MAG: small basic protein [Phycisphaerae bacterium]|nr:small basic protein [Phycisphaerae bacterium]
MSLDRSLKSRSALVRSRNVLTRAERLVVLKEEERWGEEKTVFGLPKVRVRRAKAGKAKAAAEKAAEETAAPAAAPAAAGAKKGK